MATDNKIQKTDFTRFSAQLRSHRKAFLWTLPIVLLVSFVLLFTMKRTYSSEICFCYEHTRALQGERTMTLNNPEHYDLGMAKSITAMSVETFPEIVGSQQFLVGMLADTVETADGSFRGTVEEYLTRKTTVAFWQKPFVIVRGWMSDLRLRNSAKVDGDGDSENTPIVTREQTLRAKQLSGMINYDLNDRYNISTVTVTAQDNRVAMMMARMIYDHLEDFLRDYHYTKLGNQLEQLESARDRAYADYTAARDSHSPEAARLEEIWRSFERQAVVYRAQMIYHPALAMIRDADINYLPSNGGALKKSLLLTILVGLVMGAWFCRRDIIEWF